MKQIKILAIVICLTALILSACGTVPVEATQYEAINSITGEGIPSGSDAGGSTNIMPDLPNDKAVREFAACQLSAMHGEVTKETTSVTFPDGTTKPADVWKCGSGEIASGTTLMAASTLFMAPAETSILGVCIVIGVGIFAIVSIAAALEAQGISFSMVPAVQYTPAPLPKFSTFNSGTVTPYTSYSTPKFTLNTFGELDSSVETVYMYEGAITDQSDLLAVFASGEQILYATTTYQGSEAFWTLPVADWYEIAGLARIAGTPRSWAADTMAATYPQIKWPEWDPTKPGWLHAANSRRWPIQGIMLAYEAIMHSADHIYFSPARMRIMIGTYDPYLGFIGQIFTTGTVPVIGEIIPGGSLQPGNLEFGDPMTIMFLGSTQGKIEQMRLSGCYSVRVIPLPTEYNPVYDPPSALNPLGVGRCLINNNN